MPRLFTAIAVPPHTQRALTVAQPAEHPSVAVTPTNQMHVTLHFIGQVETDQVEELTARLAAVSAPRFALQIQGVGCFPSDDRPGYLWAGVQISDGLLALRSAVGESLQACGYPLEDRPYRPHVTLARLADTRTPAVESFLSEWSVLTATADVTEFALFTVDRVGGEPFYSIRRAFPLAAPPPGLESA